MHQLLRFLHRTGLAWSLSIYSHVLVVSTGLKVALVPKRYAVEKPARASMDQPCPSGPE